MPKRTPASHFHLVLHEERVQPDRAQRRRHCAAPRPARQPALRAGEGPWREAPAGETPAVRGAKGKGPVLGRSIGG